MKDKMQESRLPLVQASEVARHGCLNAEVKGGFKRGRGRPKKY